jgi:putative transposase
MIKTYKYRLYPNREQKEQIQQNFNTCRFVWNWALGERKYFYSTSRTLISKYGHSLDITQKSWTPSRFDQMKMLTQLKKEKGWLKTPFADTLNYVLEDLDLAYKSFFKNKKGFPKFKSKRNPSQSFRFRRFNVDFKKRLIQIPKIGWVKVKFHRNFKGNIKIGTVSVNNTEKFFVNIVVDDEYSVPEKVKFDKENAIGIDLGLENFIITSQGEKIENPRWFRNQLKKLRREQRKLSRKIRGSNNYIKQKRRISLIHERIKNIRHNFQHEISRRLIDENQVICIERLSVQNMQKNKYLALSISDVSWYSFIVKLKYKAEWYGKTILEVPKNFPSSKLCSSCGYKKEEMNLSIRKWRCPKCGIIHDRDINAAINIKNKCTEAKPGFNASLTSCKSNSNDRRTNITQESSTNV